MDPLLTLGVLSALVLVGLLVVLALIFSIFAWRWRRTDERLENEKKAENKLSEHLSCSSCVQDDFEDYIDTEEVEREYPPY